MTRLVAAREVKVDSSSVTSFKDLRVVVKDDAEGRVTASAKLFAGTGAELGVELVGISSNT